MSHQRVVYAELNLGPRRQERTSNFTSGPLTATDQELTYAELKLCGTSQECPWNDKDQPSKDCPSPPEKVVAGVLGIVCFTLMITAVVMVTNVIPSTITQEQNNSPPTRTQKEIQNLSSANCCPKEWLTYSNSCYYMSVDRRTWKDSLRFCQSKNSTLLYIDSEEELEFLVSLSLFSWIGVNREDMYNPWKLINGSEFKLSYKINKSSFTKHNCVKLYSSGFIADHCEALKEYNCKREL